MTRIKRFKVESRSNSENPWALLAIHYTYTDEGALILTRPGKYRHCDRSYATFRVREMDAAKKEYTFFRDILQYSLQ